MPTCAAPRSALPALLRSRLPAAGRPAALPDTALGRLEPDRWAEASAGPAGGRPEAGCCATAGDDGRGLASLGGSGDTRGDLRSTGVSAVTSCNTSSLPSRPMRSAGSSLPAEWPTAEAATLFRAMCPRSLLWISTAAASTATSSLVAAVAVAQSSSAGATCLSSSAGAMCSSNLAGVSCCGAKSHST